MNNLDTSTSVYYTPFGKVDVVYNISEVVDKINVNVIDLPDYVREVRYPVVSTPKILSTGIETWCPSMIEDNSAILKPYVDTIKIQELLDTIDKCSNFYFYPKGEDERKYIYEAGMKIYAHTAIKPNIVCKLPDMTLLMSTDKRSVEYFATINTKTGTLDRISELILYKPETIRILKEGGK